MSSERDLEFCSGGDEEDIEMDNVHSPTDASEDSVEVKVLPISPRNRNKRKCAEPRKVANESCAGPLKKRLKHSSIIETDVDSSQSHFRPWNFSSSPISQSSGPSGVNYHPVFGFQNPIFIENQDEPLSLVKNNEQLKIKQEHDERLSETSASLLSSELNDISSQKLLRKNIKDKNRIPYKNSSSKTLNQKTQETSNVHNKYLEKDKIPESSIKNEEIIPYQYSTTIHPAMRPSIGTPGFSVESLLSNQTVDGFKHKMNTNHQQQKEQRNYKNMTRERRIEANARERTRVHTISAAFDTLRKSIPAYSHNQKLSKLSVLRIACSYILTLSRVAGYDYSADQSEPSLNDCVDLVSQTIQTEGKLRKKKDD